MFVFQKPPLEMHLLYIDAFFESGSEQLLLKKRGKHFVEVLIFRV